MIELLRQGRRGIDLVVRLDREQASLFFDEANEAAFIFQVHPPEDDGHVACFTAAQAWRTSSRKIPEFFTPIRFEERGSELRVVMVVSKDDKWRELLADWGHAPGAEVAATVSRDPRRDDLGRLIGP